MVKDAEAHAEEDRQRREEAEVRNNADSLVYQTEKVLRDQGDNVSRRGEGGRRGARSPTSRRRSTGNDIAAIKTATESADVGQPGVQPEAVRGGGPRHQRGRLLGERPGRDGAGAVDDDEIVDAEIVDDESRGVEHRPPTRSSTTSAARRSTTTPARSASSGPSRRRRHPAQRNRPASVTATSPTSTTPRSRRPRRSTSRRGGAARRARRLQGHRAAPAGRLRELPQAHRRASTPTRSTGPPASSPRRCCRCSTRARRRSCTTPPRSSRLFNLLLGELQEAGPRGARPRDQPFDPEVAEAVAARARRRRRCRGRPRCCAPATAGRAGCCARPWSASEADRGRARGVDARKEVTDGCAT